MGYRVKVLKAVATALIAACALSGCATAHLHAVNRAATLNTAALTKVGPVYDAAITARIDASSAILTQGNAHFDRNRLAAHTENNDQYRTRLVALRRHAALLNSYFTSLAELTAPGANSATTATDAELANASGIASLLKTVEPRLSTVSTQLVGVALNVAADAQVRGHLTDTGGTISDALLLQIGALKAVRENLLADRGVICSTAWTRYATNAARPRTANTADPMTAAQVQDFTTNRRTALNCVTTAEEADTAIDALSNARDVYVATLENDPSAHRMDDLESQTDKARDEIRPQLPSVAAASPPTQPSR